MSAVSSYKNYDDVLDKSKKNEEMNYRDKNKLIQQIDRLDTKDHLGILRIIMDSTSRKIYNANNYGTYIDLNDLDNQTLWKISYYVNLCLENLEREREKELAEKKHLEKINQLENDLKSRSKLKLTSGNLKSVNEKDIANTDGQDEDSEDSLAPENRVSTQTKKVDDDSESDLPCPSGNFDIDEQYEAYEDFE